MNTVTSHQATGAGKVLRIDFGNSQTVEPKGKGFYVSYKPERHEGRANKQNRPYLYEVQFIKAFENNGNKEPFAGLTGMTQDTGRWKRFRMDRIISITAKP